MGEYLFYDVRYDVQDKPTEHPLNDSKYDGASMMVVENNFGCGSSREHAPQAIMRYGIKALIGESFAEIFAGNCKALGIPTVSLSKEDISTLLACLKNISKHLVALQCLKLHLPENILLSGKLSKW